MRRNLEVLLFVFSGVLVESIGVDAKSNEDISSYTSDNSLSNSLLTNGARTKWKFSAETLEGGRKRQTDPKQYSLNPLYRETVDNQTKASEELGFYNERQAIHDDNQSTRIQGALSPNIPTIQADQYLSPNLLRVQRRKRSALNTGYETNTSLKNAKASKKEGSTGNFSGNAFIDGPTDENSSLLNDMIEGMSMVTTIPKSTPSPNKPPSVQVPVPTPTLSPPTEASDPMNPSDSSVIPPSPASPTIASTIAPTPSPLTTLPTNGSFLPMSPTAAFPAASNLSPTLSPAQISNSTVSSLAPTSSTPTTVTQKPLTRAPTDSPVSATDIVSSLPTTDAPTGNPIQLSPAEVPTGSRTLSPTSLESRKDGEESSSGSSSEAQTRLSIVSLTVALGFML